MPTDLWLVLGLLCFAIGVTLGANWLVPWLHRPGAQPAPRSSGSRADEPSSPRRGRPLRAIGASALWILLVFIAGLITARYIERLPDGTAAALLFAFTAGGLSLVRSWLYGRSELVAGRGKTGQGSIPGRASGLLLLVYPLLALAILLTVSLVLGQTVEPGLLVLVAVGSLLPELDHRGAWTRRSLAFVPPPQGAKGCTQGAGHSLLGAACLALVAAPLILLIGITGWLTLLLGFAVHLGVDTLRPDGVMLFWPWNQSRIVAFGGPLGPRNAANDRRLAIILGAVTLALVLAADIRPSQPPPAPRPSPQETLRRYYEMRGRTLVLADVEGTWQATGRRVSGRFEVLGATDDSFILLDRYSGQVFSAGPSANENLVLNQINLVTGLPVQIKAVEVHLEDQTLSNALAAVYLMQREPGLEHIFISGDLVLPSDRDTEVAGLTADLAQTTLRKVETTNDAGNMFRVQYLTAAEFIELAPIAVDRADLVIVATYASPSTGPTVTPLPSPPATSHPGAPAGDGPS